MFAFRRLIVLSLLVLAFCGCGVSGVVQPVKVEYEKHIEAYESVDYPLRLRFSNPNPYAVTIKPAASTYRLCECETWSRDSVTLPPGGQIIKHIPLDLSRSGQQSGDTWTTAKKLSFAFDPKRVRYTSPQDRDVKVEIDVRRVMRGDRHLFVTSDKVSSETIKMERAFDLLVPVRDAQVLPPDTCRCIVDARVRLSDGQVKLIVHLDRSKPTRTQLIPLKLSLDLPDGNKSNIWLLMYYSVKRAVQFSSAEIVVHRIGGVDKLMLVPRTLTYQARAGYVLQDTSDCFEILDEKRESGKSAGQLALLPSKLAGKDQLSISFSDEKDGEVEVHLPVKHVLYPDPNHPGGQK